MVAPVPKAPKPTIAKPKSQPIQPVQQIKPIQTLKPGIAKAGRPGGPKKPGVQATFGVVKPRVPSSPSVKKPVK